MLGISMAVMMKPGFSSTKAFMAAIPSSASMKAENTSLRASLRATLAWRESSTNNTFSSMDCGDSLNSAPYNIGGPPGALERKPGWGLLQGLEPLFRQARLGARRELLQQVIEEHPGLFFRAYLLEGEAPLQ